MSTGGALLPPSFPPRPALCSPHRLFAIGSQLSPEQGSSGIEVLETDTFKLHCFQTLTGGSLSFLSSASPDGAASAPFSE